MHQSTDLELEENARHIACELWAYLLAEWHDMKEEERLTLRLCIDTLFTQTTAMREDPPAFVSWEAKEIVRDLARLEPSFTDAHEAIVIGMTAVRYCDEVLSPAFLERRAS